MSYTATIKFSYTTDSQEPPSKYFPESVDRKTITIEAPAEDLNVHQYFELFKGFLRAVGFDEYNIIDAGCHLAFNECNDEAQMKKLMKEYELQDRQAYTDDDYCALEEEVSELKEKLAKVLPEQYGKEDEDDGGYKPWGDLVPGSPEAVANFCSCPVMDNAEMPNDKKWVNADCPLHGKVK
jgi:hypothetical protein